MSLPTVIVSEYDRVRLHSLDANVARANFYGPDDPIPYPREPGDPIPGLRCWEMVLDREIILATKVIRAGYDAEANVLVVSQRLSPAEISSVMREILS